MKPDKMIFLMFAARSNSGVQKLSAAVFCISIFTLIAVAGYATPTFNVEEEDLDGDYFNPNNIGLFIEDSQLLQEVSPAPNIAGTYEFIFRFDNATSDSTDSPENKGTYASDIKVFSTDNSGQLRNDGWTTDQHNSSNNSELGIASTFIDVYCNSDTPSELSEGKSGNNFPEDAIDMELLATELSTMEETGGTVNLFWTLSYNKDVPSTSLRPFNFRERE